MFSMTVEELMEKLREVKDPENTDVVVMTPYKVFVLEIKEAEEKRIWLGGMLQQTEGTVVLTAFDPGTRL